MPLPRFQKLDPDQQARILDVATAEFATHGFEGASLNRVIEAAGLSKGAMYYYVADKADLYQTVVERAADRTLDAIGPLGAFHDEASFWVAAAEYFERATMAAFTTPDLVALAKHVYRNEAGVLDAIAERATASVEDVLRAAQAVGAVRTDLPLGLLTRAVMGLLMSVDRWFADHFASLPPEELAAIAPATLGMCRDLLSPKPIPKGETKS